MDLNRLVKDVEVCGDFWAIREYREFNQFRSSRNGKVDSNSSSIDHGVMVEVMIDGEIAYYGTSDLSPGGISRAFKGARDILEKTNSHSLSKFDESVRPSFQGEFHSSRTSNLCSADILEVQNFLLESTSKLSKGVNVFEAMAWLKLTQTQIGYISSNGSCWKQDFDIVTFDAIATGRKNDIIQKRSIGAIPAQVGAEFFTDLRHQQTLEKLIRELDCLLDAPDCPNDKRDLILTPDQLYLQVHESIGHPLELDRILGDERNYAGWSFVKPEDFGVLKYGPEILNVSFDPSLPGEMASYGFDDTGSKAQKLYLIEKGVLKRGIGGLESQARSGIPGVSCARSTSWNRAPIDRMGNINIEPGESSLSEMIESTQKGILMETNNSWSIDDYRNKFQFGCQLGRLIEDGELKGYVKNPNYRGVTVDFWNSLTHVGNEETFQVWGSPYCGKGEPNQVIRVGHAIPTCKFSNIEVFGGK